MTPYVVGGLCVLGYLLLGIALCFTLSGYDDVPPGAVLIWTLAWPLALAYCACYAARETRLAWLLGWPLRTARLLARREVHGPDRMHDLLRGKRGETYHWRFLSGGKRRVVVMITFEPKTKVAE